MEQASLPAGAASQLRQCLESLIEPAPPVLDIDQQRQSIKDAERVHEELVKSSIILKNLQDTLCVPDTVQNHPISFDFLSSASNEESNMAPSDTAPLSLQGGAATGAEPAVNGNDTATGAFEFANYIIPETEALQEAFTLFGALAELKENGFKANQAINDKKAAIEKWELEVRDADQTLIELESALYMAKAETQVKERRYKDLEQRHEAAVKKAEATKDIADRIQASKLQVNLLEAQKADAEDMMTLLELESKLEPQKQLHQELRMQLDAEKDMLKDMLRSLEGLKAEFRDQINALNQVQADGRVTHLLGRLETAESVIDMQQKKIDALKGKLTSSDVTLAEPSLSGSATPVGPTGQGTTLQALRARVVELELENGRNKPFYQFASDIRAGKYEFSSKTRDRMVINRGEYRAKYGAVLVDAILALDPTRSGLPSAQDFESSYAGVDALAICQHKDFTMFHDILDWHHNLKKWNKLGDKQGNTRIIDAFNKLMEEIYPLFNVNSNKDLSEKPDLMEAYSTLFDAHTTAQWHGSQTRTQNFYRQTAARLERTTQ